MSKKKQVILGVDIGGSHIAAAAVDLNTSAIFHGTLLNEDISNKDPKEVILDQWGNLIERSMEIASKTTGWGKEGSAGIGIAIPGPFDYPNGIAMYKGNDKYEDLYGVDVRQGLSQRLKISGTEIQFFNDASSFTLGAALQHQVLEKRTLGLTLGTGFGAAFLIDRLPSMEDPSIPENGCLWDKPFQGALADDFFSTRWFLKRFSEETGISCTGVRGILATGHDFIPRLFQEFVENLSTFITPFLLRFGGESILMGGNIARAHEYFLHDLQDALGKSVMIEIVEETEVCNMLGASYLMEKNYWLNRADIVDYF